MGTKKKQLIAAHMAFVKSMYGATISSHKATEVYSTDGVTNNKLAKYNGEDSSETQRKKPRTVKRFRGKQVDKLYSQRKTRR